MGTTREEAFEIARAGAVVLAAEDVAQIVQEYIGGDAIALRGLMAPDGPISYAMEITSFLEGASETSLTDIVVRYPEKLDRFKEEMREGRDIILEYSGRTGEPVPIPLLEWWKEGQNAIEIMEKGRQLHDKSFLIGTIYRVLSPYVQLAGKLI